jgi:hypothetical protein
MNTIIDSRIELNIRFQKRAVVPKYWSGIDHFKFGQHFKSKNINYYDMN